MKIFHKEPLTLISFITISTNIKENLLLLFHLLNELSEGRKLTNDVTCEFPISHYEEIFDIFLVASFKRTVYFRLNFRKFQSLKSNLLL